MTHRLVIDCSFIMASFLPDEKYRSMQEIAAHDIFVPALFYLEFGNVLAVSLKKNRISEKDFDDYLKVLHHLPVTVDQFCSMPESIYTIAKLCNKFGITTYDASYLELALRLDAKLATNNKQLIVAGKKHHIAIV